jgi:hypothetical protein
MQYIFIVVNIKSIKIYICGLVWFGSVLKNQSEIWFDPAVFTKEHPNTSEKIRFFAVFGFFGSIYFFLFWIWASLISTVSYFELVTL